MKEERHQVCWESIDYDTKRLKVIGGWIVSHSQKVTNWIEGSGGQEQIAMNMVFIPDPNWDWKIVNENYQTWSIFEKSDWLSQKEDRKG